MKNENYSNIYQNIESVSTTSTPDEFNDGGGGGGSHIAYVGFCFDFFNLNKQTIFFLDMNPL